MSLDLPQSFPDATRLRPRSSPVSRALEVLVVAILYYAAARLGLLMAFDKTNASPVWPPSGIAFAAVLLRGYRVWPGIMLGAFLANVVVFIGNHAADVFTIVAVSSVIGLGNTLEAIVGRALLDRLIGPFTRAEDIFTFTTIALVACSVGSSIGPAAIALAGIAPSAGYETIWFTWWLGDAAGVLLVAPLLVTWSAQPQLGWTLGQRIEAALLFLSLLIGVHIGFGGWLLDRAAHYPLTFVPLPWLVWAAFRFGPREAATAAALTSGIAVWDTVNGLGPFARETVNESLLLVQAFVAVVTVTILTMAALVGERRDAQASLRKDHDTLETAVDKRTRVLWQVNERLRESESRYQLLAENVTDVIFVYDLDLRPIYVSPSVTRLRGYSVEEAMAQRFEDHLAPASAALARKTLAEVLATPRDGRESRTLELEVTRGDGSIVWTETHVSLLRDAHGRPNGIIGVARDITERKLAEAKRTQLEGQLRQAQKMEALGRLTAGKRPEA